MAETDRLLATIDTWWNEIEVLVVTGVTNARTEAANTSAVPPDARHEHHSQRPTSR